MLTKLRHKDKNAWQSYEKIIRCETIQSKAFSLKFEE
jgi:hypothetical protein